ncbi:MAG TPA: LysM domain-containing protein [Lachnospiraceae bacterium]|nr:LysM domain-containing protein [Lachnospiraceae bacterium]
MAYCKEMMHVVQQGDTFYRLAQRYQTTVPDIIMRNPGINPYNLQTGTKLNICSGKMDDESNRDEPNKDQLDLNNDLRQAWMEHVFWVLMYISAYLNNTPDLQAVMDRLEQTPEDITAAFDNFYSQNTVNQLTMLLSQHTSMTADLITAMRDENTAAIEELDRQMTQNVENIARYLSNANPKYNYDELLRGLKMHLVTTKREIQAALNNNYSEEVRLFDENTNQVLQLADYLTQGLISQFYPS